MTKTNREMINDLRQAISMLDASEAFERALGIEVVSKDDEDRKRFEVANDRTTDVALDIVASVHEELLRRKKPDSSHEFKEWILETRNYAENVLTAMTTLIDSKGRASVSDYYNIVGVARALNDDRRGWTNLLQAEVLRVRTGYIINLPRPIEFNN